MNDFVEQCRREWARLRVPEPVANEMAADLSADLKEAEAEGVSAEEVLGSSAFDPRAFAAAWAAERGVIPPPTARDTSPRRSAKRAALGALVAILAIAAGLALVSTPHDSVRVALKSAFIPAGSVGSSGTIVKPRLVLPLRPNKVVPGLPLLPVPPHSPAARKAYLLGTGVSGFDTRPFGLLLLLLGITGLIGAILYWSGWAGPGRRPKPQTPVD